MTDDVATADPEDDDEDSVVERAPRAGGRPADVVMIESDGVVERRVRCRCGTFIRASAAPAAADVATATTNQCPNCGWTPKRPTRGGPPVHVAVVIDDVVHPLGRCPSRLIAAAADEEGGSL